MKKCHLASQVCRLPAGCPLGPLAATWDEVRQQAVEAQSCGDAGPHIPPDLMHVPMGDYLLGRVSRSATQSKRLIKEHARHEAKGGDRQDHAVATDTPAALPSAPL